MHFTTGVILKKEIIDKRIEKLRKIREGATDFELEFESIVIETDNALVPLIEKTLYPDIDNWEGSHLDWYIIGGRWQSYLPIKENIKAERKDANLYEVDDFSNDYMSYGKIKDILFKKTLESDDLLKCKEAYDEMIEKSKGTSLRFILNQYPTFEDFKIEREHFNTHSILTSDKEWIDIFDYEISDLKERDKKIRETFNSIIEKEDKENYFILTDCHI